jgi:hypothetical protein
MQSFILALYAFPLSVSINIFRCISIRDCLWILVSLMAALHLGYQPWLMPRHLIFVIDFWSHSMS